MYRFFKTQNVCLPNMYHFSKPLFVNRLELCSFCKVHHSNTSLAVWFIKKRCYGTMINDTEIYYIKKKAKLRRKYAELLEVTAQATSNKKAAITKLSASHVSLLVNSPDVTLDKLHKINDSKLHGKRNKRKKQASIEGESINIDKKNDTSNVRKHENVIDSMVFDNCQEYTNETCYNYEDIKESKFDMFHENSSFSNMLEIENIKKLENDSKSTSTIPKDNDTEDKLLKNIKTKEKCTEHPAGVPKKDSEVIVEETEKINNKDERVFTEYTISLMFAQMDAFITCKMFHKAEKMIKFLIPKVNATSCTVRTELCNMLLDAYSLKRNITEVLELYNLMINNCLINPQTYAIVFDSIGRIENKIHQKDLFEKVESDMINNEISFHDIFNKARFKLNQVENLLKTIQSFRPEYQPEYFMSNKSYDCKLLNNIYEINSSESPAEGVISFEKLQDSLNKQIDRERQYTVHITSIEKFNKQNSNAVLQCREKFSALESLWEKCILKAFERNLKYLERREGGCMPCTLVLHPFLKVLEPQEYVTATMQEIRNILKGSEYFTPPMSILCGNLGSSIYRQYDIQTKEKTGVLNKTIDIYNKYLKWYLRNDTFDDKTLVNSRIVWQNLVHKNQHYGASIDKEGPQWPYSVCVNVGKFLYNIIINDIKININHRQVHSKKVKLHASESPAFYTLFRTKGKAMLEQIKPHPILCKLYKDTTLNTLSFDATLVPSLCPPRPWTSVHSGGYTISKVDFVRAVPMARNKQISFLENTPHHHFYPALDNLNQLGSVPWKINTPVLDVLIEIFQKGGSIKLKVPQPPSALNEDEQSKNHPFSAKRADFKQKQNEMYSLWCDCLYKLSLANHLRNNIFWLPHNLDFRGRVYTIPPHLTHLGSDLSRSILIFAQGKPLGPQGLDWLKIHTINLTGLKKRESVADRLKFANENIDKIVDSAEHPLTGHMWWIQSDEPWQTLASCMEVTKALKSPNPEKYVSSFPVHQDGSCNGLQHYAALGRDTIGAKSVNLFPCDKPQDVYSVVVSMIEKIRSEDAEKGIEIAQVLQGHIKRKVIKQTVMTTVYGVTKYGAKLQIFKQLKDLDNFPSEHIWEASTYLALKTFECLRTMFMSARTIQDWLTNCSYIISSILNEHVEWVTPLGFPVLQPYFILDKSKKKYKDLYIEKVDTLKQRNAFPPNFIHSLDSSHMMLTSLFCEQAGVTFVSVHDCYWTHPCTIDIMNKICREQFVALHSKPILQDLSIFLEQRYTQGRIYETLPAPVKDNTIDVFRSVPKKGSFELTNVLNSKYFFS